MTATGRAGLPQSTNVLAQIRDLSVSYRSGDRDIPVLTDVSLAISPGETLALVGESGSGKSTLAATVLGHLRPGSRVVSGSVHVDDQDIFEASSSARRDLRNGTVAFVPQNAGHALTPSMRVGKQVAEVLRFGRGMNAKTARAEAIRLLGLVRLPQPDVLVDRYSHQLSGGQQQRVAIAMAVASQPRLLVMDEPTTGLDVVTQAGILSLLDDLRSQLNLAVVLVSHDLGVVASICDRIAVMYAGRIVEAGSTEETFRNPAHPYTRGLLATVPKLHDPGMPEGMRGNPPHAGSLLAGCSFAERCPLAEEWCMVGEHPTLTPIANRSVTMHLHSSACLRALEVLDLPPGTQTVRRRDRQGRGAPLLQIRGLEVDYRKHADPHSGPTVLDFDLDVHRGEVVALVGESGSGKSTIAWTLAGLRTKTAGDITLLRDLAPDDAHGFAQRVFDLGKPARQRSPEVRRQVQMIFQNADTSLNPRRTVGDTVARPMKLFGIAGDKIRARRDAVISDVGLDPTFADRLPGQLSGGQRQRVGIARALAAGPTVVLADEVVSSLDVSVQASVLRLLDDLREEHELAYLFISHDLAVVRGIADRVVVLYLGRVCEEGPVERVFTGPNHPYTRLLIDSVLEPVPGAQRSVSPGSDEPESAPPPRGCPFARRCPWRLEGTCEMETPPWRSLEDGHRVRCHLPIIELEQRRA